MLGHSSDIKEQRGAVQRELNSSYHVSLENKPSSIAPLCVSMILKQLSDASECCYLPQVVVILPVVSLRGQITHAILTCLIQHNCVLNVTFARPSFSAHAKRKRV